MHAYIHTYIHKYTQVHCRIILLLKSSINIVSAKFLTHKRTNIKIHHEESTLWIDLKACEPSGNCENYIVHKKILEQGTNHFLYIFLILNINLIFKLLHHNFDKFAIKVAQKFLLKLENSNNILNFDCNKTSPACHNMIKYMKIILFLQFLISNFFKL